MTTRQLLAALLLSLAACKPPPPTTPDAGSTTPAPPVPAAPSAVTAAVEAGAVVVRWTLGETANATQLVIARATVLQATSRPASTELQVIAGLAPDVAAFTDDDVEPGHFYVYAVALRGAGGRSDFTLQADSVALSAPVSTCAGTITATDGDGDGLSDADELAGWDVLVDEDGTGTLTTRAVKSGAFNADTDGDGLCDDEESSLKLDPRQADTDGDGLTDFEEVNRWGSSPTNVDSDGDAHGNPGFYDGRELLSWGTSPTLADSDGDGRSDFEELNQNGTNPLVAELPEPALAVVGRMDLGVDVQLENGMTQTDAVTQSFEQGTSTALTQTSSSANQHSIESSFSVTAEASVGYPASASVSASGSYSQKEGFVQETSASVSRTSASDSQQTYETLTSGAVASTQTITGGHLAIDFEVRNEGTRTFQLGSVVVTALRRDRASPGNFTSVATLQFPPSADNLVLAEGQVVGPIRAQANISGNVALDLLSNPGTLFFRTANFNLTDKTGQAFSFAVGEETTSRTALLTIDYGGVRPLERYRVATNVERTASGKAAGVKLHDVLERVLGLAPGVGFETQTRAGGTSKVLTRLRDVEARPGADGGSERFWVVLAPENPDTSLTPVGDRLLSRTLDLEDAVLMPRDSLTLAFVSDRDSDKLFDREELMYGSFDGTPDSDSDGLTDYQEVREGWTVTVDGNAFYRDHPRVFSVPTSEDADRDGWPDLVEKSHGTDPNRRDTDGDGINDPADPAPTQGPSGKWVKVLGTSGNDVALQVVASADTVYVLGTTDGDIDGDSTAGGPFLLGLDATTGAQKWALQLEGSTHFSKKVTLSANGSVVWVTDVVAGRLPGAGTTAMYGLNVSSAGVVTATELTNTPFVGAYSLTNVPGGMQEADEQGTGVFFVAPYRQFNGNQGFHRMAFTPTGAYGNGGSTGSGNLATDRYALVSTSTNGRLAAAVYTFTDSSCAAGGSRVDVSALNTNIVGSAGTSFCGAAAQVPQLVGLDREGGMALSFRGATRDTLELRAITGAAGPVWTKDFLNLFSLGARVTSLSVDDANQYYVGLKGAGAAALQVLNGAGAQLDLVRLGDPDTSITSTRRDVIGNLFLSATALGGFQSFGVGLGGTDLVISRNPQLAFP